jgi:GNAT superfamily N-acetyltransferase
VRVEEPYRGHGLGRQLVQSAAGLMVRRDIRAIEAVGSYREGPSCIAPAAFLQRVGFSVIRQHPVTPRLRMDLQATARWLPDLGAAWNRLTGLMPQPAPGPEPAHRRAGAGAISGAGSTP